MNKPHRRFVRYARGKNFMQANISQNQGLTQNDSAKFLNSASGCSSEYLTQLLPQEQPEGQPKQSAPAPDEIEVIKSEPQKTLNCGIQQSHAHPAPQPQRFLRSQQQTKRHPQQQPIVNVQPHQQQPVQHQQHWRSKATYVTPNYTPVGRQVLSSSLNKNHKVNGAFSDTAICSNQNTRHLLQSIACLSKTLDQIIEKLKKNDFVVPANEHTATLVCTAYERTATINRRLQYLERTQQCYRQTDTDSFERHRMNRTTTEKYQRPMSCGNCVCNSSMHSDASQQPTKRYNFNSSNSNNANLGKEDANYIQEFTKPRTGYAKMITRATTMHNDILQVSNICIGYRLTMPVHLIQYLAMIFICVSYWLQKNNGFVVYFLVIGLIVVTVHMLSRNVYYYTRSPFTIANDTKF